MSDRDGMSDFEAGHLQGYNQGHADALKQRAPRLDLVAKQQAEIARLRAALEEIAAWPGDMRDAVAGDPNPREIAREALEGGSGQGMLDDSVPHSGTQNGGTDDH